MEYETIDKSDGREIFIRRVNGDLSGYEVVKKLEGHEQTLMFFSDAVWDDESALRQANNLLKSLNN